QYLTTQSSGWMPSFSKWPPLLRVPLRYGLMAGALGFILLLILYYTNHHPFVIPVFVDFRIALFAIVFIFALKELRDYYYEGILHFWQGMLATLLITAVFAIIASACLYLFASNNQEFVQSYIDLSLEQVQGFADEDIDRIGRDFYESGIASLKQADASFLAIRYFWQSFIISFFLSIIISVILRRQPKL
ncbi:MAG TPA: DUF4199 domain-containing protein, partial [Cyclobacteriaceae bacterium]|nr:DUF4199 domain-containing protein [Cyclobacteriaceae bacterium]